MEAAISKHWHQVTNTTDDVKHPALARSFTFPDFVSALRFANKVGEAAERIKHHPEMIVRWGEVVVITWTHTSLTITDKDKQLAREIDSL